MSSVAWGSVVPPRHGILALLLASAVGACAGSSDDGPATDAALATEVSAAAETDPLPTQTPATEATTTAPPTTAAPATGVAEPASVIGDWTSFDGGPDCVCADGSEGTAHPF